MDLGLRGIGAEINKQDREMKRKISGKSIREPIPSGMRKKALEKARHKCQWRRCKIKAPMPLDVHHMNMKSDDNRVSNFKIFCPTHHRMWHQQHKLVREKDLLGNTGRSKVVKVKKEAKKKKTQKKEDNVFGVDLKDIGYF